MANNSVKTSGKPFAHIRIKWTIKNFCLALRNGGNWIHSPEFVLEGDCVTNWRMILHIGAIKHGNVPVSFILERRPEVAQLDDISETVFVDCELKVKAGNERYPDVENTFEFQKNIKRFMHFPCLQSILENLRPFTTDQLEIVLNMIVRGGKYRHIQEPPEGLFLLSKDLLYMFGFLRNHDITLVVDGNEIKAHKFMLNRIDLFRCMLSQNPDAYRNILRLRDVSFRNMHKFVEFIYSGNMISMLMYPSLSMYKLLKDFRIDTALCYYVPERMILNTTIPVEEASWFYWKINDFSYMNQECLSPLYRGICSKVTWQLRLNPLPWFGSYSISLFAEVLDSEKPHNTYLEFGLLGAHFFPYNHIQYSQRVIAADMNDENVGFPAFIGRHALVSQSLVHDDDSIYVVFRPQIPANENASSEVSRFSPTLTFPGRTCQEELSAYMGRLLNNECDLTILAGDEILFAHRGVMEARCSKLRERLQRLPQCEPLVIKNISGPILRKLLDFIYRGILVDCNDEDLEHVNNAARKLGIRGNHLKAYRK